MALQELLGGTAVLLTRGADGMTVFRDGHEPLHVLAMARNVFDVTGADDSVVSVLSLALAAGASLMEAAELANRAGGLAVGKVGTALTTSKELLEAC